MSQDISPAKSFAIGAVSGGIGGRQLAIIYLVAWHGKFDRLTKSFMTVHAFFGTV